MTILWDERVKVSDFHRLDIEEYFNINLNTIKISKILEILANMQKAKLIHIQQERYELTLQGTKLWEKEFQVNWEKFYVFYYDDFTENLQRLNFIAKNKTTLEQFLMDNPNLVDTTVVFMEEWQPTYWKTLKNLYSFNLLVKYNEPLPITTLSPWKCN